MQDITSLEKRLWEAAYQLRANSKLTQTEYPMPVLDLIFLRYAAGDKFVGDSISNILE